MSLKRAMDRMRAGKDNEILAMSKQSQAREMLWKDKFKRREEESRVRAQELMEMSLMTREEADTVQYELKEQLRGRDELVGELKAEVNRLAEQVLDLEHQKKEMEDYKQSELLVSDGEGGGLVPWSVMVVTVLPGGWLCLLCVGGETLAVQCAARDG